MILAGVNGGGTKTEAVCCDENGKIVGRGSAGPSNYQNVGMEAAMKHIEESLAAAGFPRPDRLCVALAGINTSTDFQMVNNALLKLHPGAILEHDAFAELYFGARGKPGVMAISGTGSVVLGYDGKSRHRRCDLGWFLGDEGSGYYIGREGIRATARMIFEGEEETILKNEVLSHLGLKNQEDIMAWAYSQLNTVTNVASVTGAVERAAQLGDKVAINIFKKASSNLADHAMEMALKINVRRVHIKGGVFNSPFFYANFMQILANRGIDTLHLKGSAAMGPLLIVTDKEEVKVAEE